jgi:hypothetical protein
MSDASSVAKWSGLPRSDTDSNATKAQDPDPKRDADRDFDAISKRGRDPELLCTIVHKAPR